MDIHWDTSYIKWDDDELALEQLKMQASEHATGAMMTDLNQFRVERGLPLLQINVEPPTRTQLQAHHEITHWIPDDGLLTTDPDGRVRPVYQPPAPEPPDYSAEGLMDIVVDFDPFYEQNLVKGFRNPLIRSFNPLVTPENRFRIKECMEPVDRDNGLNGIEPCLLSGALSDEPICPWHHLGGEDKLRDCFHFGAPNYCPGYDKCKFYKPLTVDRGDGGGGNG